MLNQDSSLSTEKSSTQSRSASPAQQVMSLQIPVEPPGVAGRTRSSSPSETPSPLIIKARSQVCRVETLESMRDEIPKDAESTSVSEVLSLLGSIEELHKSFLQEHAHLEEFWPVKCLDHEYFASNVMSREAKIVTELRRSLKRLTVHQVDPSHHTQPHSSSATAASRAAKLPELALPTFSGKYVDWPTFSELFTSLIINDKQLMEIDRLYYLKSSLSGEPARRINAFPLRGSSFQPCWEFLNKRFSNKRLLIKEQLDKLLSITPITSRSATTLKDLAATITEVDETLAALNADKDMHNCLMVHVITNNLDKVTREAWETSHASSSECPRYRDLLTFIENKGEALEQMESSTKKPSAYPSSSARSAHGQRKSTAHPATQATPAAQPSSKAQAKYPCDWCKAENFIVMCPQFRDTAVGERRRFIVSRSLCKNCCGRHKTEDCKSAHRCKTCGAKHHTMLHPPPPATTQGSSQPQPKPAAETSSTPPTPQAEGKNEEQHDF